MPLIEVINLIVFVAAPFLIGFLIAFYLHRKYSLFQKLIGVLALFGCFVLFVILHNVVYGLFYSFFYPGGTDELVFFILSFVSLGASIALLVILAVKKVVQS